MRLPRRSALLLGVGIALPGVAACGSGHAGSAAVVGEQRITTEDLTARVQRSLKDPTAKQRFTDKAEFQRRVLTLLIDHDLISAAAKRNGVTVSDADVQGRLKQFADQAGGAAALEKQAAAAGIAKPDLKGYVRDLMLTEKVGDKLVAKLPVDPARLRQAYEQQYAQVHAAHILVKDKATADKVLAQAKADPKQFASLAKKYSTDPGSKDKGGDLGTQPPSSFVGPFAQAVSAAKVGSLSEVQTQFGWHVIKVIDRKTTRPLSEVQAELRGQLLQQERQKAVAALLAQESKRLKISVNPRFGRWDATKGQVVPRKDPTVKTSSRPSPTAS
jgi:foldase protein PrsA